MTLNGEMALILRYFTEFGNGPYFALFHRIRVRCRRKTIIVRLTQCFIQVPFFGGGLPPNIETSHQEFSAMTAVKLKIMSIPVTHLLLNVSCLNFIILFAALVAEYFRQRK